MCREQSNDTIDELQVEFHPWLDYRLFKSLNYAC